MQEDDNTDFSDPGDTDTIVSEQEQNQLVNEEENT